MTTSAIAWLWQAARIAVVLLILAPLLVRWEFVSADLVPTVDGTILVRALGLGIVLLAFALLVRQKHRSRGRRPTEGAPERPGDRQVEGNGEVYAPSADNSRREARREGDRIRERAEEVRENDRGRRR